jgi:hypothetical protein
MVYGSVWLWVSFPPAWFCISWMVDGSVWLWDGFPPAFCCIFWRVDGSVWLWDGFPPTCCCICWLVYGSVWLWDGFHQVFDRMSSIPVLDLMQAHICKCAYCMAGLCGVMPAFVRLLNYTLLQTKKESSSMYVVQSIYINT